MAVVSVTTMKASPDQFEPLIDGIRKSKVAMERLGGVTNVRLLSAMIAGEQTGTLAFIYESEDFGTFGQFLNASLADPESRALLGLHIVDYQNTVWTDIPL